MTHRIINPLVDCVFKSLFGSEDNEEILIDFLNAILEPRSPITKVSFLSPINRKQSSRDSQTIVDVMARDQRGFTYQIEVQLQVRPHLPTRILYSWADTYQAQLPEGDDYPTLRPHIAIWLLGEDLFRDTAVSRHRFTVTDQQRQRQLTDQLEIHTIELRKEQLDPSNALDSAQRWIYFLREGWRREALPAPLDTPAMRKAMSTLARWSERETDYLLYRKRLDQLREQRTLNRELRESREGLEQALTEIAQAHQQLSHANEQLSQTHEQLSQTHEQLSQTHEQLTQATEQLNREREDRERAEAELRALRAQLAAPRG